MKQLWITLPALAPDYSGVCSAMFDLGGISVIHDASGCTGNYVGYDEPRWYGSKSKVFCSALREIDAVLGRDDKLIDHIHKAGEMISPTIYTVVGSPVPMVIGSDMAGIARELEKRTGVPSFGFDTNGLALYNKGVSMAMQALIKRFTIPAERVVPRGINILGTTPLDFSANSNAEDLARFLEDNGLTIIGKMMMGATIDQIRELASAQVNLVVTESGFASAKLLKEKFGTPYVVGNIVGRDKDVLCALEATLKDGEDRIIKDKASDGGILIIGEQVTSNSLRRAILNKYPHMAVTVGSMTGLNKDLAGEGDYRLEEEWDLLALIESGRFSTVIGDPLIEDLLPEDDSMRMIGFPHVAVSSKICWKNVPHFIGAEVEAMLKKLT